MKYIIIALVVLSTLFGAQHLRAEFSVPKPFSQEDLVKVASRAPDAEVFAVITLEQSQLLQNLESLVKYPGIQLKSFTLATQNRTSGYTLRPGESVQEAVDMYVRDRAIFGQKTAEMAKQISTTIEKKSNAETFSVPGLDQANESSENLVTSIEVIGSAQAVLRWQSVNSQNVSIKHVFDATRMKQ